MKVYSVAKSPAITIKPTDSIRDAAMVMAEKKIGFLPVVDNGVLVGVVSERDIVNAVAKGIDLKLPVATIMKRHVITVDYNDSVSKAAMLMRTHGIRHLVVLKDGEFYGVLSIRDLVKEKTVLESIASVPEQLELLAGGD